MSKYCDMCGTNKHGSNHCPNCQEEAYIFHEQYMNPDYLGNGEMLEPPAPDSDFMRKVRDQHG
ncbi:hypothetical protein KP22_03940 [Pectobacterium betavasculorum]|uniref:Uncharacterized protein n=1 Tax=Pectobacterium betavasculorum TaxID=55207 RepID=A0A093SAT4_9GAMM|nr:hypothetical protein [Pectobacterium betavasculorum]KFX07251.1 hypothetical protein KP22_03940 [Pectobacterium betavasculorum]